MKDNNNQKGIAPYPQQTDNATHGTTKGRSLMCHDEVN